MTTLYSAAVTIDGSKKRSVEFELGYSERIALRLLIASITAVRGLNPAANTLVCGTRVDTKWCQSVAEGLENLIGLSEEEAIIIEGEHIVDLRLIRKQLNDMFKGTTAKDKSLTLDSTAISQLIAASEILATYTEDEIDLITIDDGGASYSVTRTRIEELIKFLNGVHKNVLIK